MAFIEQIPVLQVAIPLVLALLCSVTNNKTHSFVILMTSCIISITLGLLLVYNIPKFDSQMIYHLGKWQPEYGIALMIKPADALLICVIWFVLFGSSFYGIYRIPKSSTKIGLFCAAILICATGMTGMIVTGDVFNLYVFLEIFSLSTYTIIASYGNKQSYTAAFEYLIIGTVGATFYLIGIGFLYSTTGTLNMEILSLKIAFILHNKVALTGMAFVLIGFLVKSALFPLHFWLTNAYAHSSGFVCAFLSGTSTKVAVYVLIKFIYLVFGRSVIFEHTIFGNALLLLATFAILFGSILSFMQKDLKKLLAYSSVAQIGYIIIAACIKSHISIFIVFMQIIAHSLAKPCMFILADHCKTEGCHKSGIGYFIFNAISLAGIPITAGFVAKVYLFNEALASKEYTVFCALTAGSVFGLLYLWKGLKILLKQPCNTAKIPVAIHFSLGLFVALNALTVIYSSKILMLLKY